MACNVKIIGNFWSSLLEMLSEGGVISRVGEKHYIKGWLKATMVTPRTTEVINVHRSCKLPTTFVQL